MLANLALSLSLYSGQMCTTPQNLLIPGDGVDTDEGHKDFDTLTGDLAEAIGEPHEDAARSVEILGAIVGPEVRERAERAARLGDVVLASLPVEHPRFPGATVRTPALVRLDAKREDVFGREHFGPVAFAIPTEGTSHGLELLSRTVRGHGALSALVHSREEEVLAAAERTAIDAGVNLSCNLTGGILVNQSAAFSDFHGTGANRAATASLTDPGFVATRFHVVQSRRPVEGGGG
jgi:phenylacetic acid degradation protein paaN